MTKLHLQLGADGAKTVLREHQYRARQGGAHPLHHDGPRKGTLVLVRVIYMQLEYILNCTVDNHISELHQCDCGRTGMGQAARSLAAGDRWGEGGGDGDAGRWRQLRDDAVL